MPTLAIYFNDMDDPRRSNAPRHEFCDLMTISLLCALCGSDTAVDMELFGHMKEDFPREFLEFPHGVPCHDAYSRLFRLMKPASASRRFSTSSAPILPRNARRIPSSLLMAKRCGAALTRQPNTPTKTS